MYNVFMGLKFVEIHISINCIIQILSPNNATLKDILHVYVIMPMTMIWILCNVSACNQSRLHHSIKIEQFKFQ